VNCPRAPDLAVRSKQGHSFHQGGGADDAVRWILRIGRRKFEHAHAGKAADRQDDEPRLDFAQERFDADVEADAPFVRERFANSSKVTSEMANPSPVSRASLIVTLAFLES